MSDLQGTVISLDALDRQPIAYLSLPDGDGPWPGVVVIQEWWGLEDHIKGLADRFASIGFAALAPDLYYGKIATEPDEASKLRMALDWDNALAVIQGAVDYLIAHEKVSPKKVGMTGFCMGGGLTWHAAAKLNHVAAIVPFYGGGPEMSDEEVAQINCKVLAIFGELDQGVSPEVAQKRVAQMDKAGIAHETIVYPQAHHAFFNDTRPVYHPEAAADAWERMTTLFRETLA
ncbi:MAG: dienelactone hydrolase family protein [Chloroflexota bacterium]